MEVDRIARQWSRRGSTFATTCRKIIGAPPGQGWSALVFHGHGKSFDATAQVRPDSLAARKLVYLHRSPAGCGSERLIRGFHPAITRRIVQELTSIVMPLSAAALPPAFSWLRPADRPSAQEVDTYAHLIANREGYPSESAGARLLEEAELQLWIWRAEIRKRAPQHRRISAAR